MDRLRKRISPTTTKNTPNTALEGAAIAARDSSRAYPVFPAGDRVGRLRPQAAPHQKPRSERGQALGLAAAPAVARPPPGRPTRVFGQGACAWAALVAGAGPIGFGRGVVELHVEGCLLERTAMEQSRAASSRPGLLSDSSRPPALA